MFPADPESGMPARIVTGDQRAVPIDSMTQRQWADLVGRGRVMLNPLARYPDWRDIPRSSDVSDEAVLWMADALLERESHHQAMQVLLMRISINGGDTDLRRNGGPAFTPAAFLGYGGNPEVVYQAVRQAGARLIDCGVFDAAGFIALVAAASVQTRVELIRRIAGSSLAERLDLPTLCQETCRLLANCDAERNDRMWETVAGWWGRTGSLETDRAVLGLYPRDIQESRHLLQAMSVRPDAVTHDTFAALLDPAVTDIDCGRFALLLLGTLPERVRATDEDLATIERVLARPARRVGYWGRAVVELWPERVFAAFVDRSEDEISFDSFSLAHERGLVTPADAANPKFQRGFVSVHASAPDDPLARALEAQARVSTDTKWLEAVFRLAREYSDVALIGALGENQSPDAEKILAPYRRG